MVRGTVYDVLGLLVLLLVLASRLDRNKHRSRRLLLVAGAIFAGTLISWCLELLGSP